ncbi:pre-miRNA 5'-monophosphate methyltransferase [Polypterus senegalus]
MAGPTNAEREDPGAAPYGNFINYYSFNPPENRLTLVPSDLLKEVGAGDGQTTLVLDVGCNSGELTVALYRHLLGDDGASMGPREGQALCLLGCDLDAALIHRAAGNNPFPGAISFLPLDITDQPACDTILSSYLSRFNQVFFDLCTCLAVTMWVHLNHGDAGLLKMLSSLAVRCRYLLLEVQPWKCYQSAARRLRKLGRRDFEHFKELQIRGDVECRIREYLEAECQMELLRSFGSTSWKRNLLLFKRTTMTK